MEQFYNKLVEFDQHFGSEEFKLTPFGDKKASKYEYQPIVRHPERDNDEETRILPTSLHQGQVGALQ